MRQVLPCAVLAIALLAPSASLRAQTTDASISGVVRSADGTPLADATVTARHRATGFTTRVTTGANGRFGMLQLPLGGPYVVTAARVGYEPATREAPELRLGDRIALDITLAPAAVRLAEITVAADTAGRRGQRVGGNLRVGAEDLAQIPTVNRNFTDLASLAPTSGAQQALLGQRWTSTDFRFDGAQARNNLRAGEYGAGPYTLSMEAIREFEVNGNVYDVSQGRQGGGSISAASKFGTNTWTGSAFGYLRSSGLSASTDFLGRGRDVRDFRTIQWGGSVGGPIVRDRLHLFVAFDRQDAEQPLFTGYLQTPADEISAGVARDSLTRLVSILAGKYGLDTARAQVGRLDRSPVANTVFARLDWTLSAKHRLTLRHNYSDWSNPLSGGVDQPIALYEARSDFSSREHQALAALRSTLSGALQNELKVGFSHSSRVLTPVSDLPRGFVRIRSALPNGTTGDATIQFGGNRLAPDDSRESQLQLIDQAFLQRGDFTFTLGTANSLSWLRTYVAESQSGLFTFNSLGALDSLKAARYQRTVALAPTPTSSQRVLELGAFAQAEWRPSARLTLTGGVRWDASAFLTAPDYNPLVDSALGVRNDRAPESWFNLQPRLQVVWNPHADGRDVVRAGGGLFVAELPYYLGHNQILNNGLQLVDIDLRGAGVPTPDYPGYRQNPNAIPGVPTGGATPPSYVNVVRSDFRLPHVWKGSVAYQRRLAEWLTVTGSFLASRTTGNYYYTDLNLRADPAFTLDNEANRPVFVPAASITNTTPFTNNRNALKDPRLSRVLGLTSIGEANQLSAIAEASVRLPKDGGLYLAYTWNRARDNSTYGCCLARTAATFTAIQGDPRDLQGSWGPSDLDFRHKVVAVATSPALWGFRLSARYVGQTGLPFSLVVNGDINGDESNANDLAFLFDPNDPATAPDVAASMRKVLANPDNVARDYIASHLGQIAGRNTIYAPWNSRVDLRLSKRFATFRAQSAELTVDVFNFLNLLNGDWGGQYLLPAGISTQNPVLQRIPLLNVIGFDQATRRYRYSVNENVGVLQKQGDPYTIQLGVRYGF
jgi:hypothetical protein